MKLKSKKKNFKDFLLSEDAKISKKALLVGGLWLSLGLLSWVAEAGHSSNPCWGWHSSSIWSTNHTSAVSHASHSSY